MAELNDLPTSGAAPAHRARSIPAHTQLVAIAWLRWRMFVNTFRRRQTGHRNAASLVLVVLLRVFLWPIFAMMALGPVFAAGFFAYMAIHSHHPEGLIVVLGGATLLWQFIAINGVSIAATLSSFDPASLLRFPLRFGMYLVLRLLLGLLTPSTIVGCLGMMAAAIGLALANFSLAPAAVVALAIYAAMNIFLARMIAAWMERWLATRRAREIFGAMMALFFVSVQFLNFHQAGHAHARASTLAWMMNFLHRSSRALQWLPPGFAANAITLAGHPLAQLAQLTGLLAWTALIFAAFAARLHKQFLGEYFSEGAPRSVNPRPRAVLSPPAPAPTAVNQQPATYNLQPATSLLSPTVAACLRKEWLYLRGNGGQLVGLLTPLIFVFILSKGMLGRHPSFLLSGAVGYALMGPLVTLYNIFGADAAGVQMYLLAPIRLRDVILAKNIASLALLLLEATLAWCVVLLLSAAPIPAVAQVSSALWIVFVIAANLTVGTLRSIQAPRKAPVPGQTPRMRPQAASKTTGLLVLALLFGSLLLQVPVTLLCRHFHNPWLAVAIFAPLAAAAVAGYVWLLRETDRLVRTHRDLFAEELCSA